MSVIIKLFAKMYFRLIAKKHQGISVNKTIVGGEPTIKGRRIQVWLILSCLRYGLTFDDICKECWVQTEDIQNALDYAVDLLKFPWK